MTGLDVSLNDQKMSPPGSRACRQIRHPYGALSLDLLTVCKCHGERLSKSAYLPAAAEIPVILHVFVRYLGGRRKKGTP